ncbi:MAG: hypothetical protein WC767_02680, partial [Candidatus Paceibacterota bacterium]
MKKIFFALSFALLPFSVQGQEATSTPPAAPQIQVNMNVRYRSTLVWSGPVTLTQGETRDITDNGGTVRPISSDSALAALVAADEASSDFSISNLDYYSDFNSFYIKCIDIVSPSEHACDNWQYVVDSAYPPMGASQYTVSDGSTLYFYFGTARRVTLSAASAEASVPISVKAETYDYTNDTWNPLSGASIGATQPNPADPYSPLVISSVTSESDGTAQMSLETPGTYAVGLAIDYYFPTEALTITAPAPTPAPAPAASASADDAPAESTPPSSSGRSSARREAAASAASVATIEAATSTPVVAEIVAEPRE